MSEGTDSFLFGAINDDGYHAYFICSQAAATVPGDLTITTASGKSTVSVSALSYAYAILNGNNGVKSKNAIAALYTYYKAAIAYRN